MEETDKSCEDNNISADSQRSGANLEALPTTCEPSRSRSLSGRLRSHSPSSPSNGQSIRKRSPSVMMGKIITREETVVEHADHWLGKAKKYASILVEGNYTANFLGIVVLLDAYLTANDIDSRARGEPTSRFVLICSDICLFLYTSELPLLFLVRGKRLLKDWMVILDIVIILCGYVEIFVNLIDSSLGTSGVGSDALIAKINVLRVLRLARIVRLMQLLRRTRSLKELQKLVTMLATCLKALLWCFLFCFVIMTIWAMLLVEIVHPIVQEIYERDGFEDCVQCQRATGSVMDANLLLFKTVIAGDSWGLIAVPVIEAYPLTAVIFCGSLLTLVFGVLNMIAPKKTCKAWVGDRIRRTVRQFILPVRLACGNRRLRRLWCAGFMLMFAGQLVMDIGGQYFNQSMDLIPYGTKDELTTVAVLTMVPGQLLAIPGNLITGYLSKRGGPLYLLRRLVPIASILVTVGAFMAQVQQFWFIAVTVICLNYAGLPNVPLMRLVSGLAPPGRVGESLSAIGIAAQLASLIGNAAVVVINHHLMGTAMANPLWIYYPICGTLTLMAILPIRGTPYGGWGAASGIRQDQWVAVVFAHVAQQRWRKEVARRKALRAER